MTELLIVVIIMGILAIAAVPAYRKAVERGYWRETQDVLLTVYYGERAFFASENLYKTIDWTDQSASNMTAWREIFVDKPAIGSIPVRFRVTTNAPARGPSSTFVAEAELQDGSGKRMTINKDREWCGIAGNNDPGNCPSWPYP